MLQIAVSPRVVYSLLAILTVLLTLVLLDLTTVTYSLPSTFPSSFSSSSPSASLSSSSVSSSNSNEIVSSSSSSSSSKKSPSCRRDNSKVIIASIQHSGTHWLRETLMLHPKFSLSTEVFKLDRLQTYHSMFRLPSQLPLSWNHIASIIAAKVYGMPVFEPHKERKARERRARPRITQLEKEEEEEEEGTGQIEGVVSPSSSSSSSSLLDILVPAQFLVEETQGFILQFNQVRQLPQILEILRKFHHWKALHLVRENLLNVFLSAKLQPHSSKIQRTTVHLKVRDTLHSLGVLKTSHRQFQEKLDKNNIPTLTVVYEALLNGTQTFCQVWKFLECSCLEENILETWFSSATAPSHRRHWETIENYDEIHKAFEGTEWMKYLEQRDDEGSARTS